ncbi:MAG: hypothetical protein ACYDGY_11050 [Acidimicrobiales bacterium]
MVTLDEGWPSLKAKIEAWQPPDGEERYRVAKAALLRDEAGVLDTLRAYDQAGHSVRELESWPLIVQMKKRPPQVAALIVQLSKPHAQQLPTPRRQKGRPGRKGQRRQ